jgi:hypothetical protein
VADQDNTAPTEREKWEADQRVRQEELALKRRELELRESDARRARWWNPLVLAVFTAALAGIGNIVANFYSSSQQRIADAEKATQTEKLESEKAEATLILEVVKTGNPDRAAENLKFLVDTKLITSPARRNDIVAYIKQRKEGQGVAIPTSSGSRALSPAYSARVTCAYPTTTQGTLKDIKAVAVAIDQAMETISMDLTTLGIDRSLPWQYTEKGVTKRVSVQEFAPLEATIRLDVEDAKFLRLILETDSPILALSEQMQYLKKHIVELVQKTLNGLPYSTATCIDGERGRQYLLTSQNIASGGPN